MSKKHLLLGVGMAFAISLVCITNVNSELANPPEGSAGDAYSGTTCAQSGCHAGPEQTPANNDLTLKIDVSVPNASSANLKGFQYTPGTTYFIAFVINKNAGTNPFYGFQIASQDANANQAGAFTVTDATHTTITTAQGREYMGHNGAGNFKNWTFKWTAPASGAGPVTFAYAYNVCSASVAVNPTEPEGTIYRDSAVVQEGNVGIEPLSNTVQNLSVFPSVVNNRFNLVFNNAETIEAEVELFGVNGQKVSSLMNGEIPKGAFNRSFETGDIAPGVYFVRISANGSSVTEKIFKQ